MIMNLTDYAVKNVEIPSDFLDSIYVGRCKDRQKTCSRHFGKITDVNIWNRALSVPESLSWTNCSNPQQGDLVSWTSSDWEITNMKEIESTYGEICQKPALGLVLVPGPRTVYESTNLCMKLTGEMNVVSSSMNHQLLTEMMNASKTCTNLSTVYRQFQILSKVLILLFDLQMESGMDGGMKTRREKWYPLQHLLFTIFPKS